MLGKILAALKSLKFTIGLIFALALLSLVGVTVPQKGMLGREAYLAWQAEHPTLVAVMVRHTPKR